jgi:hypothetical protein
MTVRVIYSSEAVGEPSPADLEAILDDARPSNEAAGITGVLVFADGVFLQVLEGERDAVDSLVARIARDPRNRGLKVFYRGEIDACTFESWHMAYLSPSAAQMADWVGLEGTVTIDRLLAHLRQFPDLVPRVLLSIVEALAAA